MHLSLGSFSQVADQMGFRVRESREAR